LTTPNPDSNTHRPDLGTFLKTKESIHPIAQNKTFVPSYRANWPTHTSPIKQEKIANAQTK